MRLGYHRKVPLEFSSEPPFWSYVQNKASTKRENTGIYHKMQNAGILPGLLMGIVAQREPRRIKISGLGQNQKMRRASQHPA
jgi:hypothetical protein